MLTRDRTISVRVTGQRPHPQKSIHSRPEVLGVSWSDIQAQQYLLPLTLAILLVVYRMLRQEYNRELSFYRQHHRHALNWALHTICVPIEWFSWLIGLRYLHSTLPWFVSIATAIYYLLIDQSKIFFFASFAHIMFALLVDQLFVSSLSSSLWLVAVLLSLCSWAVQIFIGHFYFEKNSPAMATKLSLNSIVLSVLLAWDH
jgi:uncharacterized membrane protein YGL010W